MKILHLTSMSKGGAWIATKRIVEAQRAIGIDSDLFSIDELTDEIGKTIFRIGSKIDHEIQEQKNSMPVSYFRSIVYLKSKEKLSKIYKNYDLINLHWVPGSVRYLASILELDIPKVMTLHDMHAFTGGCHHAFSCINFHSACKNCPQVKKIFRKRIESELLLRQEVYKKSNLDFVAPSLWIKSQFLESAATLFNHKVTHIPNPINLDFYPEKNSNFREMHNHRKIRIGVLGSNYLRTKLMDNPIKFISRLKSKDYEIQLVVIGRFYDSADFNQLGLDIEQLTEDQTKDMLFQCDLFFYNTVADNLPNLLIECQALGVPIIAFDVGGVSETFETGQSGFIVKDDSNSVQKLRSLLIDAFQLMNFSRDARLFAQKRFSYPVIANKYHSLYRGIISNS